MTLSELLYFTIFVNSEIKHFNMRGAEVYVAQFDEATEVQPVAPLLRQQAIEQCGDVLHRQQRFCVWRLLDYALREQCGKGVDELSFNVDDNGKWSCNGGMHFSLSHSGNVVAVAVCTNPVGVDVEAVDGKRFNARLAQRILTENERAVYNNVTRAKQPRVLAEFWTQKESIFKRDGGTAFVAKAIDTTEQKVNCQLVKFGNVDYVIATAN